MVCYTGKITNSMGKPLWYLFLLQIFEKVLEGHVAIFMTFSDLCWIGITTILMRRNAHDPFERSAERAFGFVPE